MKGERFYVALDGNTMLVIGWNLDHEPDEENECGYPIEAGPFSTKQEAEQYIEG